MLEVRKAHIAGRHVDLLPPTSLEVKRGQLILVRGDGQEERTALALALTARMKPVHGDVFWDGSGNTRALRKISAIVDAPEINEPESHLRVTDLVTEDLALIPRRYRGALIAKPWLKTNAFEDIQDLWIDAVAAHRRVDLLTQLALADPNVDLLVLDSPDRHSADPNAWLPRLQALAADEGRPLAVVAVVAHIPEGWNGPTAVIGNSVPAAAEPAPATPAVAPPTEAAAETPVEEATEALQADPAPEASVTEGSAPTEETLADSTPSTPTQEEEK